MTKVFLFSVTAKSLSRVSGYRLERTQIGSTLHAIKMSSLAIDDHIYLPVKLSYSEGYWLLTLLYLKLF